MVKSALGWNCRLCTFFHSLPATRCSMCGQLRGATKQEMADFVLGKRLRPPENGNVVEILSSSPESENGERNDNSAARGNETTSAHPTTDSMTNRPNFDTKENAPSNGPQKATATTVSRNPYGKVSRNNSTKPAATSGGQEVGNSRTDGSSGQLGDNNFANDLGCKPAMASNGRPMQLQQQGNSFSNSSASDSVSIPYGGNPSTPALASTTGPTNDSAHPTTTTTTTTHQIRPIVRQQAQPQQKEKQTLYPFFDGKVRPKKKSRLSEPLDRRDFQEGPVPHDKELAKTYIYPQHDDYPIRQYQLEMTETALNYNTLVSLPTGLGKTHIAAVVMYNFYRWFAPHGKIIFLAPTLPLVNQQVEACYRIMGLPAKDTAVMTGRTGAEKRYQWWEEKRVFYCTPQTVQKDFQTRMDEANETGESSLSLFASQVVCLVLDEAHKASGDYAYTKVIQLLDNAGAKYRIVGLSATPGTTIKAVQDVISALNIVKVAARTEEDESVAPYLHQKISEIIICERSTHQRDIERRLSDILGPLLERLRREGGLAYVGNANLSAYTIHNARENFMKSGRQATNGYLTTVFKAAHTLISIRSDCHQSLGVVKKKLRQLKNSPQTGELSKIVKSQEFDDIYRIALEATEGTTDDSPRPAKDPKISKLCQVLQHHFILSEDAGTSSRAIVFAQFRDSVGEIVDSLEAFKPMIRARYFVGQGKGPGGSKKNASKHADDDRVSGMKQAEQQKAIRQFRENIYNVLVCTSIGEEGLDIGDVDLIVNYDVLRSPIRTIQRAGRTGRKRNGRVICLISEGQEEQTYIRRKQAEQTLANALKDPKRFTVHAHRPMLPALPSRDFQKMSFQSQLHLSQVAGAHKTPRTTKLSTNKGDGITASWRLAQGDEEERKQYCGIPAALPNSVTWKLLTKYLLKCRADSTRLLPSKQRQHQVIWEKRKRLFGRNFAILHCLEEYGRTNTAANTRGHAKLKKIFPTEPVVEDSIILYSFDNPNVSQDIKTLRSATMETSAINAPKSFVSVDLKSSKKNENTTDDGTENIHLSKVCDRQDDGYIQTVKGTESTAKDEDNSFVLGVNQLPQRACNEFRMPTPPPSSSSSDDESESTPIPQPAAFQNQEFRPAYNGNGKEAASASHTVQSFFRQDDDRSEIGSCLLVDSASSGKPNPSTPTHLESRGDSKALHFNNGESTSADRLGATCPEAKQSSASPQSRNSKGFIHASQEIEIRYPGRATKRRKMALADSDDELSGADYSASVDPPQSISIARTQKHSVNSDAASNALVDTPEEKTNTERTLPRGDFLTDTPLGVDAGIELFCEVCKHDDSECGNRIILCDACNAGFHQLCYSIPDDIIESEGPWFCDLCMHRSTGSQLSSFEATCVYCSRQGGPMKNTNIGWCHSLCKAFESKIKPSTCSFCSKKRSVNCEKCLEAIHPYCALSGGWTVVVPLVKSDSRPSIYCPRHRPSTHDTTGKRILPKTTVPIRLKTLEKKTGASDENKESANSETARKLERIRRRREGLAKFVLEEADIASDQDDDGDSAEEEEVRRIEEEEGLSQDSFINDNPELTQHFSQDELADEDPDAANSDGDEVRFQYSHRALDAQRDAQNSFKTPLFNRRMMHPTSDSSSVPTSQRGLGQMNFIRSVLDHHRQGGKADEIEQLYQKLEQEGSPAASTTGWE
ncbi:Hef nuclease [Nitzschia inconspicua]|uniref:Hef nuclease n=1 Tax=Nitzschia inconspicua TaxID=303405 RepID=A0A9K3M0B6_9STRA|nr:Hef nuclease [Nitzschia inconspicua]